MFFSLVGLAYYVFGGPSDIAAILINTILGTLTVGLVWWVGRSWFGPQTGIAAAALLAFSEYHIGLSRTALTDVAFGFFFLLALACVVVAFQRQSIGLSIVAGLMVGLAWNTKYHGWFALLIAGAALLPFAWYCRAPGVSQRRSFLALGYYGGRRCSLLSPLGFIYSVTARRICCVREISADVDARLPVVWQFVAAGADAVVFGRATHPLFRSDCLSLCVAWFPTSDCG